MITGPVLNNPGVDPICHLPKSRSTIILQPELKNEIDMLRVKKGKIQRVVDLQSTVEQKDNETLALKTKNQSLQESIKKLRQQLEIVHGELYNQPK